MAKKSKANKKTKKTLSPEEVALKEAQAATREAQKAADKVKADKVRENKKVKAQAEAKGKQTTALRKMAIVAKEVNHRFESAKKMEGKADDHRLAAAIRLAEVKQEARAAGINFKEWVEREITEQSWETVRKLVTIGEADDPALALEDMRNKNKGANKKLNAGKADGMKSSAKGAVKGNAGQRHEPFEAVQQDLLALDDKSREAVVASVASKDGNVVMGKAEVKDLRSAVKKSGGTLSLGGVITAFDLLSARDRMKLLKHAAKATGVSLNTNLDGGDEGSTEMPDFLKRTKKSK